MNTIALLATGDEVCQGDILNTNSQEIAALLVNIGMQVRTHMTVPDNIAEIETAIHFLLQSHQAIIITGGLGPTSDDLTRFALANALQKALLFDDSTWQAICDRLKKFGYDLPPESNKQQALFPQSAQIIPNPNGTAAGCVVKQNQQIIFMLPGPPTECLPMVNNFVIDYLQAASFQHIAYRKKWLLFGVSEGKIAEELDELVKPVNCMTGYRLAYPYIEFKIFANNQSDLDLLIPKIEKHIQPYLIGDGSLTSSQYLKQQLLNSNLILHITDKATGGSLESTLKTPHTRVHLHFHSEANTHPHVAINGLKEYWSQENHAAQTELTISYIQQGQQKDLRVSIPFRGKRVIQYAVEFICREIAEIFLPGKMH